MAANATSVSRTGELLEGARAQRRTGPGTRSPRRLGSAVRYFTGVACESSPSGSRSACAAVGRPPAGPIIAHRGQRAFRSVDTRTPSSLPGAAVLGIPLETAPATPPTGRPRSPRRATPPMPPACPTSSTPSPTGTSSPPAIAWAEAVSPAQADFSAAPGGAASATVPLSLLPLKLVTTAGVPGQRSHRQDHGRRPQAARLTPTPCRSPTPTASPRPRSPTAPTPTP